MHAVMVHSSQSIIHGCALFLVDDPHPQQTPFAGGSGHVAPADAQSEIRHVCTGVITPNEERLGLRRLISQERKKSLMHSPSSDAAP